MATNPRNDVNLFEERFSVGKRFVIRSVLGIATVVTLYSSFEIVSPGYRGVRVTMGNVSPNFVGEGPTLKWPFISRIYEVTVRQWTLPTDAECYSSDLQQVKCKIKVLYRAPETQVVPLFQQYQTEVFQSLVAPRVQEALKEITAGLTAEQIVKQREQVKQSALAATRTKVGALVTIDDIVIENIDLTDQLEQAIESKMVQEQEASKSKFKQDQAKIDAETKIIAARGDAESIKIQGEALKQTPDLVQLKIVEKWDGHTPMVVGATTQPTGIMLPMAPRQ